MNSILTDSKRFFGAKHQLSKTKVKNKLAQSELAAVKMQIAAISYQKPVGKITSHHQGATLTIDSMPLSSNAFFTCHDPLPIKIPFSNLNLNHGFIIYTQET